MKLLTDMFGFKCLLSSYIRNVEVTEYN